MPAQGWAFGPVSRAKHLIAPPSSRVRGAVAQLGERYNGIVEVWGSIPHGSTNKGKGSGQTVWPFFLWCTSFFGVPVTARRLMPGEAKKKPSKTLCFQGLGAGWGTRIRTWTDGVRVRCSTVKLSPSRGGADRPDGTLGAEQRRVCITAARLLQRGRRLGRGDFRAARRMTFPLSPQARIPQHDRPRRFHPFPIHGPPVDDPDP